MIHLDEPCGWTNKQSQKSEWIIWIDHTNESFGWRWQMVKQTAPMLLQNGWRILTILISKYTT